MQINSKFKSSRVLITGVCGTIGKALIRELVGALDQDIEIIGIDNNESELFFLAEEYKDYNNIELFSCDITNLRQLERHCKNIDIILHTAALKHVIINEKSPDQTVQTNIIGTQNIINAAQEKDVNRVIFTSSDKAVNPTNVMGTTKLLGERLITAANFNSSTIFASTRFGNVLGSNGSVVTVFERQLKNQQPITITDRNMTRFVMSINQAARLVLDSAFVAIGGEVLITKMPVIKIETLADAMINHYHPSKSDNHSNNIEKKYIGSKPGEKMYEELMSDEETLRAVELEDYFSVIPALIGKDLTDTYQYDQLKSRHVTNPYNSSIERHLNFKETTELLFSYGLLN